MVYFPVLAGTEKCGRPIFKSKADPDYRKIMDLFTPLQEMLEQRPRADMLAFDTTR